MFKRRWKWFGELVSDEGFSLGYGHKSITYRDERGSCEFGLEDEWLFPTPHQTSGMPVSLDKAQVEAMVERVVRGIRSEGHEVRVWKKVDEGSGESGAA